MRDDPVILKKQIDELLKQRDACLSALLKFKEEWRHHQSVGAKPFVPSFALRDEVEIAIALIRKDNS